LIRRADTGVFDLPVVENLRVESSAARKCTVARHSITKLVDSGWIASIYDTPYGILPSNNVIFSPELATSRMIVPVLV
jgi:hypothetical protein